MTKRQGQKATKMLYLELSYATIGLELSEDETVLRTPPIASWAKGKKAVDVIKFYFGKEQLRRFEILGR